VEHGRSIVGEVRWLAGRTCSRSTEPGPNNDWNLPGRGKMWMKNGVGSLPMRNRRIKSGRSVGRRSQSYRDRPGAVPSRVPIHPPSADDTILEMGVPIGVLTAIESSDSGSSKSKRRPPASSTPTNSCDGPLQQCKRSPLTAVRIRRLIVRYVCLAVVW
jgi:hypothetical protein